MTNGQHVGLNNMTQTAKLCMSTGTKIGIAQKGNDLEDSSGPHVQQRKSQLLYLKRVYQLAETWMYTGAL